MSTHGLSVCVGSIRMIGEGYLSIDCGISLKRSGKVNVRSCIVAFKCRYVCSQCYRYRGCCKTTHTSLYTSSNEDWCCQGVTIAVYKLDEYVGIPSNTTQYWLLWYRNCSSLRYRSCSRGRGIRVRSLDIVLEGKLGRYCTQSYRTRKGNVWSWVVGTICGRCRYLDCYLLLGICGDCLCCKGRCYGVSEQCKCKHRCS